MRWFVRSDLDGFFGLAVDNLVQLLLIVGLCQGVLGFSDELLYAHVFPGAAVSLVIGNLFYAHQARRVARREGRDDVCALPYGINTVSIFAYVFLVMLPARIAAEQAGHEDPARVAWHAGLLACFGSGLIEFFGAFVAERIRRASPRAALLSTLSGIALGFISMPFVFRTFAQPLVGLTTLGIVLLTYFGRVRIKGGLPGGLVAVLVGTALAWLTGLAPGDVAPTTQGGLHLPIPVVGDLLQALRGDLLWSCIPIIIPMGLFNVLGSLQNIESAEAAGDRFATAPSLAVNGLGTLAASLFGSCFPTTIYIGHPGWKSLGARAGYSIYNAVFLTVICLTGTVATLAYYVPLDAGMAIVLWIGIVITAQAFSATESRHGPAVVMGLLPGVAAWGALMAKSGLAAAGVGGPNGPPYSPALIDAFRTTTGTWIHGAFALEQGFIFTAMLLAGMTVAVIERRFLTAAIWCWTAAALSATGLMHAYAWTPGNTVLAWAPAWPWVSGYGAMGACFFVARWAVVPQEEAK